MMTNFLSPTSGKQVASTTRVPDKEVAAEIAASQAKLKGKAPISSELFYAASTLSLSIAIGMDDRLFAAAIAVPPRRIGSTISSLMVATARAFG
jgi:hypothetical protein